MRYPTRSIGRVIECLKIYEPWFDFAHTCQIGDGRVSHQGKHVATFTWPDDNPLFDFVDPSIQERQFCIRPFLGTRWQHDIPAIVHDVRERLTFGEALAIRHVRDKLNGGWNDITVEDETVQKIERRLKALTQRELPRSVEDVRHIAMCAIYSIPQVADRHFVINIDGAPAVSFPVLGPPRLPTETLDLYAEQYGIERKSLTWSVVRQIPEPNPYGP